MRLPDSRHVGSNPTFSATSPQALYRLRRLFCKKSPARSRRCVSSSAKGHAAPALFACKRAHNAHACLPTFCRCACGIWYLFCSVNPRRSKLHIACSDFFQKSERTHSAAPPFPQKVTLGSPARLYTPSRRFTVATNFLRVIV